MFIGVGVENKFVGDKKVHILFLSIIGIVDKCLLIVYGFH